MKVKIPALRFAKATAGQAKTGRDDRGKKCHSGRCSVPESLKEGKIMRVLKRVAGKKKGGFTLVEVVISLAILTIASAAALQAIHTANILSINARETTMAINDAKSALEMIKVTPLGSFPENTTLVESSVQTDLSTLWLDFHSVIGFDLANEQMEIITASGTNVRQITIRVTWTGPGNRTKTVEFATLKSLFNG